MSNSILSVDLAAKLSAVVQRGVGGEVTSQFDSRDRTATAFLMKVVQSAMDSDIIVIEDVPYGITSQAMVKPVIRLQGFLIGRLIEMQCAERTVFMSPSVWMKDYPGVQHSSTKGLSKAAADKERIETAASHAERAGYVPPDLVAAYVSSLPEGAKVLKKNTNILEKSMTDYVSAWLMSEYARTRTLEELLALPGCSAATL